MIVIALLHYITYDCDSTVTFKSIGVTRDTSYQHYLEIVNKHKKAKKYLLNWPQNPTIHTIPVLFHFSVSWIKNGMSLVVIRNYVKVFMKQSLVERSSPLNLLG